MKKTAPLVFILMILASTTFTIGMVNSAPPYPIPTGPLTPTVISMVSPTTTTYVSWFVPLKFSVSGKWDGYLDHYTVALTIDGESQQVIYASRLRFNAIAQSFSVTLGPLSEGVHQLQVFVTAGGIYRTNSGTIVLGANDVTSQASVYFTVDTANQAQIQILSPQNETYNVNKKIPVEFIVNHTSPIESMGYTLDEQSSVIMPKNTTLYGTLSDGLHTLKVYSVFNDIMPVSSTVNFTVDTTAPSISILSLQEEIYNSSKIPLIYTVNETTSLITYILDNKVATTTGNTTFTILQNGDHKLTVYATDDAGNAGASETIDFKVIVLLSPEVAYGVMPPLAIVLIGGLSILIYLEKRKQLTAKKH